MSNNALDALIVKNLADLDMAAKRLEHVIEAKIGKSIYKLVHEWAKPRGWIGDFEYRYDDYLWVTAPEWAAKDNPKEKQGYAWFTSTAGENDDLDSTSLNRDYFWLTRLCRLGEGEMGFRWHYNQNLLRPKKREWKDFVVKFVDEIRSHQFRFEEGADFFFIGYTVDHANLVKAIEEDAVEDAIQEPIRGALDRIEASKPSFDKLVRDARKAFRA